MNCGKKDEAASLFYFFNMIVNPHHSSVKFCGVSLFKKFLVFIVTFWLMEKGGQSFRGREEHLKEAGKSNNSDNSYLGH